MSIDVLHQHRALHRQHLTEARVQHHWSQGELAELLGTTQANVSRWERGITRPSPYFRQRLCALFGKQAWELDLDQSCSPTDEPFMPIIDPLLSPTAIPLVGREKALAHLKARLQRRPGTMPLVIYGLPGVGKCALALALAHDPEVRASFPDGILWVSLGPAPKIAHHLTRWGKLLGLNVPTYTHGEETTIWVQKLRLIMASRSMLLIIDNAWDTKEVEPFLVGGPRCAHLVTTRLPVLTRQLTTEAGIPLKELDTQDSMTLLSRLAPKAVQLEEQAIIDLVHKVGGIPLALRLIGKYLHTQSYNDQPRRIHTALDRLRDADERMRLSITPLENILYTHTVVQPIVSLYSTIAASFQQLQDDACKALYMLSVFPARLESLSEQEALAMTGTSADILHTLCDAGLLEATSPNRYSLHPIIADYAYLQLRDLATRRQSQAPGDDAGACSRSLPPLAQKGRPYRVLGLRQLAGDPS